MLIWIIGVLAFLFVFGYICVDSYLVCHYIDFEDVTCGAVVGLFFAAIIMFLMVVISVIPCVIYNYENLKIINVSIERVVFPSEININKIGEKDIVYIPEFTKGDITIDEKARTENALSNFAVFTWENEHIAVAEARVNGSPLWGYWNNREFFIFVPKSQIHQFIKDFDSTKTAYANTIVDTNSITFPETINTVTIKHNTFEYSAVEETPSSTDSPILNITDSPNNGEALYEEKIVASNLIFHIDETNDGILVRYNDGTVKTIPEGLVEYVTTDAQMFIDTIIVTTNDINGNEFQFYKYVVHQSAVPVSPTN